MQLSRKLYFRIAISPRELIIFTLCNFVIFDFCSMRKQIRNCNQFEQYFNQPPKNYCNRSRFEVLIFMPAVCVVLYRKGFAAFSIAAVIGKSWNFKSA